MMSDYKFRQHLPIKEQHQVLATCRKHISQAPLREKLFLCHGDIINGVGLFAATIYIWGIGFRAFNMYKFSKGRLVTVFTSGTQSVLAGLIHCTVNLPAPLQILRPENPWHYGFKSLMTTQLCMFTSFTIGIGYPLLNAQLNGMTPLRYDFLHKGKRLDTAKYILTALKPYSKRIFATYLLCSAAGFTLGVLEYKQSCNILAKQNRRTISVKED